MYGSSKVVLRYNGVSVAEARSLFFSVVKAIYATLPVAHAPFVLYICSTFFDHAREGILSAKGVVLLLLYVFPNESGLIALLQYQHRALYHGVDARQGVETLHEFRLLFFSRT